MWRFWTVEIKLISSSSWFNKWARYMRGFLSIQFSRWQGIIELYSTIRKRCTTELQCSVFSAWTYQMRRTRRFYDQIYSIMLKIHVYSGENGLKFTKIHYTSMTLLRRQKLTKQSRICRFSTRLIENNVFANFMLDENLFSANWYKRQQLQY